MEHLNELELFLEQTVSPERASNLIRAADLLVSVQYTAHEYPIKESMMGFDDADPGTIVVHIAEILIESLKRILQLSSIVISHNVEEQHIPVLCDIITGLTTSIENLDSMNLVSFLERDEEPEDLLAELVSLVTDSPIETVREVIESFRQETMDGLLEALNRENDAREESMISLHQIQRERREKVIARIRKYMQRFNPSIAKRLIVSGFELGLPEGDVYYAVSEDVLLMEKGTKFAEEFIGIMLLTDKDPESVISDTLLSIEEINFEDPAETMNATTWLAANKDNILSLLQEDENESSRPI